MEPITAPGVVDPTLGTQSVSGAQATDAAAIEDQFIQQAASTVFSLVIQIIQGEVGKGQA